jgi:ABC-type Na+ efflux pump permease subunit
MAKIKILAPYVLILILFIIIIFQSQYPKSDLKNRLNELHKQNDSLLLNIKLKQNEITKLDSVTNIYKDKVEKNKIELTALKIKADNFKIKYNEEHNRINTLSNGNVVNEFTNAFE